MDEEQKKRIQEIIDEMQCYKDFKCCEDNLANVCRVKRHQNGFVSRVFGRKSSNVPILFAFWERAFLSMSAPGLYR